MTETIFLACCTQRSLQTAVCVLVCVSLHTVSQDVLTLHCELHVAVGGACSILSCARVASRMTEFSRGDFYWTCDHIIIHQINIINEAYQ